MRGIKDIAVRCAQHPNVALQPGIERGLAKWRLGRVVRGAQMSAVFFEPRNAKDFCTQRFQHGATARVQHALHGGLHPRPLRAQALLRPT